MERKLNVLVSSGDISSEFGKEITKGYLGSNGTIFADKKMTQPHAVSIIIQSGSRTSSNVLAHEGGHSFAIAINPAEYLKISNNTGPIDCQTSPIQYINKDAMEWQNHYDKLKRTQR